MKRGASKIAFMFLAVCALSLAAQSQSHLGESIGECTYHFAFPESDGVKSMAFAPDSASAFVHMHVNSINAWNVAVHFWPEAAGVVAAVLLLQVLLRLAKIRRRPQSKGSPYCRRCNYDLTTRVTFENSTGRKRWISPPETKCPECGVDLSRHKPKSGRTAWMRLAPSAVAFSLCAAVFIFSYSTGAQRFRAGHHYFDWSWEWVNSLAEKPRFAWLNRWQSKTDRIVQIELNSGNATRRLLSTPTASYLQMCVSPDGESLFLGGAGPNSISRYSTRAGRLAARFTAPGNTSMNIRTPAIIRFSSDGQRAYVSWLDQAQQICGVSEWNLKSNQNKTLITTAAHVDQRSGRSFSYSRQFLSSEQVDPPTFISFPHFMEAYPTKTYKIRTHVAGSDVQGEFQPTVMPDNSSDPVLTPDGQRMILSEQYGGSLMVVDVASGKIVEQLSSKFDPFGRGLALSRDGSILGVGMHQKIKLRDMTRLQWYRTSLELPDGLYGPELWLSNDNRWLAAVCQKDLGAGARGQTQPATRAANPVAPRGFTHELVFWDLSKVRNE